MKHNELHLKGLGIELRAIGLVPILVAALIVGLLIYSVVRVGW